MDLGVHKDLTVEQEEYTFDVGFQEDMVSLLINSPAQMITEKLKSMVRFGIRNTRYKDVIDICFLIDRVNIDQLKVCIQKFIFADSTLHNVSSMSDIYARLERIFRNPDYVNELKKSGKNWLDLSEHEVIEKDLAFIRSISD